MSINLLNSTPILLSKVPSWVEKHAGFKPNRSTVFRWTKRGARGRKLKTFSAGGRKCTTVEALLEFFSDDQPDPCAASVKADTESAAAKFLDAEGL